MPDKAQFGSKPVNPENKNDAFFLELRSDRKRSLAMDCIATHPLRVGERQGSPPPKGAPPFGRGLPSQTHAAGSPIIEHAVLWTTLIVQSRNNSLGSAKTGRNQSSCQRREPYGSLLVLFRRTARTDWRSHQASTRFARMAILMDQIILYAKHDDCDYFRSQSNYYRPVQTIPCICR